MKCPKKVLKKEEEKQKKCPKNVCKKVISILKVYYVLINIQSLYNLKIEVLMMLITPSSVLHERLIMAFSVGSVR